MYMSPASISRAETSPRQSNVAQQPAPSLVEVLAAYSSRGTEDRPLVRWLSPELLSLVMCCPTLEGSSLARSPATREHVSCSFADQCEGLAQHKLLILCQNLKLYVIIY